MIKIFFENLRRNIHLIPAAALICASFIFSFDAEAQAYPGTHPFGGFVSEVLPCTCECPGSAVVVVGPPRGGAFMYDACETKVYEYYQIPRVGVWLLGNYKSGGKCKFHTGGDCVNIPHEGMITIVGTSR